jgi:nucleoside diphosphate kinase
MAVERTLILAEPDAVARGLSGEIVARLADADRASLRGSCALAMPSNLVRGSDPPESAEREIAVWFADVLV